MERNKVSFDERVNLARDFLSGAEKRKQQLDELAAYNYNERSRLQRLSREMSEFNDSVTRRGTEADNLLIEAHRKQHDIQIEKEKLFKQGQQLNAELTKSEQEKLFLTRERLQVLRERSNNFKRPIVLPTEAGMLASNLGFLLNSDCVRSPQALQSDLFSSAALGAIRNDHMLLP